MNTLEIVRDYLKGHLMIALSGEVAELDNELDRATSLDELTEIALSSKAISIGHPNIVTKYQHNDYPLQPCIDAECFLKHLRDSMFQSNRKLVMCKIDTGGLSGYQHRIRARGETVYPLLQVTLKVKGFSAKTVWIHPEGNEASIDKGTRGYLERRGILQKALKEGIAPGDAELVLFEYLDKCGLVANSPESDNTVQLVCASGDMYRAFLNTQVPNVAGFFSPKYVDITPYNAVLEALGQYEAMCYARYENDPIRYVEALETYVDKAHF